MDTSSSRVRKEHHYWTVPWDAYLYAKRFKFWGEDESQIIVGQPATWRQHQEALAERLIDIAERALSVVDDDKESEAIREQVRTYLQDAFAVGLDDFDAYLMQIITSEINLRHDQAATLKNLRTASAKEPATARQKYVKRATDHVLALFDQDAASAPQRLARERVRLEAIRKHIFERGETLVVATDMNDNNQISVFVYYVAGILVILAIWRFVLHKSQARRDIEHLIAWTERSRRNMLNLYLPNNVPSAMAISSAVMSADIRHEIDEDIYGPLFNAQKRIRQLIRTRQIRPADIHLRVSENDGPAKVPANLGRPVRAAFLPMKGDPWQTGHLFIMLEWIAYLKLDKIVVMVDNSDPTRKPDLSSLGIREPITKAILKEFGSLLQYTPLPKEHEELFAADGETVVFKLVELNKDVDMEMGYVVGSDHRFWVNPKGQDDTAKKLHDHQRPGTVNAWRSDPNKGL
jgi:tryptophanyl-tRNA synthetase